jgi:hypothetical protein
MVTILQLYKERKKKVNFCLYVCPKYFPPVTTTLTNRWLFVGSRIIPKSTGGYKDTDETDEHTRTANPETNHFAAFQLG